MNAIVLCAGLGKRFQPLSFVQPKPLTRINGVPLLEQTLQLLRRHGVERISIVVGYLAETFAPLAERYGAELCFNPRFADTNNNTSLAVVRDRLDDTLILDGDLYFEEDFFPHLRSGVSHFVSQCTTRGLEWELRLNGQGQVVDVDKWSPSGWGMVGVSYWTGRAAALLAEELPRTPPDGYWEDAALRVLERTPVYAACVPTTFVREMDCVRDALDMGLLTHEEIARQCSVDFVPQKLKGLTNNTWLVRNHHGALRTLRVPGKGTDRYIRREHEPLVLNDVGPLGITPDTAFYPGGFKTTTYLEAHRISTAADCTPAYFAQLANVLQQLHSIEHSPQNELEPLYITQDIQLYEDRSGRHAAPAQRDWLRRRAANFDADPQVLCHRDLLLENILVSGPEGRDLQLIDFEYAGFTHPLWDAASFILEAGIEGSVRDAFIHACGLETQTEALRDMEILVDYVWGLWGLVNNYEEYGENRLHRAKLRLLWMLNEGEIHECRVSIDCSPCIQG